MRPQTLLVMVLALAFGGVAAGGVFLFSGTEQGERAEMTTCVVAAADIPRGQAITAEMVAVEAIEKSRVKAGTITKVDEAIGRTALFPLVKGETIFDVKLAPKGMGRGLATMIKRGMRAVTVPTPSVATNIAGFIEAGSRVDILWTSQDAARGDRGPGSEAPLLENVEVLAVDSKIDSTTANRSETTPIKSVTVQVTPAEAAKLAPALARGTIHLSLRNPGDDGRAPVHTEPARVEPARVEPVRPAPPPRAVVIAPPAPHFLRTIRGTHEGSVRIDVSGAAVTTK